MTDLDIPGLVDALNAHGVRYVVIGGAAAFVNDLPLPMTIDLDITPSVEPANLARLAEAFEDLEAGLLTADEAGTWFPRHPVEQWAQYDTLHLITRLGLLDVVFTPDGAPRGFDDLAPEAEKRPVGAEGPLALVISAETWERLKHASGRAKDLEQLDQLEDRR